MYACVCMCARACILGREVDNRISPSFSTHSIVIMGPTNKNDVIVNMDSNLLTYLFYTIEDCANLNGHHVTHLKNEWMLLVSQLIDTMLSISEIHDNCPFSR